ncbi:uncharacterized protein LOC132558079 [Ylistrum balloti]|uniref:uncharacterized protein LOC132558079 n=1 Tax=Ylistrum balloti TaxID=509963 RepID=UPI002905EF49|nr:uncharacterized protein LOC132558079 [Ylistrum balloti]
MNQDRTISPLPLDFSNNFSGIPTTPPVLPKKQGRPLFSIGVDTTQKSTCTETERSPDTNLQDVGGAHLKVEKKTGINRSASSPTLSQFLNLVQESKFTSNVNLQANVSGFTADKVRSCDDSISVHPQVQIHSANSTSSLVTQEPSAKHVRKEMQSYYSRGEVNKYGSLFRKPGLDHKVSSVTRSEFVPEKTQLLSFPEEEESSTPDVSIGQRVKKWMTTSPVKQTNREKNAIFPSSF